MPASIRFKPGERILIAPEAALRIGAAAVAELARAAVAEAESINEAALGHPVSHADFVNGVEGADYEAVQPGQSILAVFDLTGELLGWILDQLRDHAPVKTGRYLESIVMLADGVMVGTVADATAAAEIIFTSLVPYARKIEGTPNAKKPKPPQSEQAPNGVFQAVAELAKARFGNQASIKFTYREPTGGATELETWARKHSAKVQGANKRRHQYLRDVRQPAVVVTFR